jgi:hypothetical protein
VLCKIGIGFYFPFIIVECLVCFTRMLFMISDSRCLVMTVLVLFLLFLQLKSKRCYVQRNLSIASFHFRFPSFQ